MGGAGGAGDDRTRVLLIRHGQSTWNADGRWQGHADPPLSELGEAQAVAAAEHLDGVDVVVSSDLERARRTAEILAAGAAGGVGENGVVVEPRLRERDAGEWTGLTRTQIEAGWPGYLDEGRRPPRFEDADSVAARALAALEDLHRAHTGSVVLAVAHGGVIRALERATGVRGPVVANLGGRWFEIGPDGVRPGDTVLLVDPDEVTVTIPLQP
jgi:probable phosphoglycerate mutase